MTIEVTLQLPDAVYRQAKQTAQSNQQEIADVLMQAIMQTIPPFPVHKERETMLRETRAYKAMHAELAKQYLGQYVAIHQGKLVDHDADPLALLQRVRQNFPNQVVLRRKVTPTPEITLYMRSPRFLTNK
jgi:hypothetical protein